LDKKKRNQIIAVSAALMIVFIILGIMCYYIGFPPGMPMDYIVIGIALLLGPYGIAAYIERKRIMKIESRLPDFLRDVAEASRFGMTLADSLIVASTGRYGVLTNEIKKIAAQISWGVPVNKALELFQERVPTPLVNRMVAIIIKANEAGGNIADVLNLVAHASRETQVMERERAIQMSTYAFVLYIAFGVFLVTIIILNAQFLPQMEKAGKATAEAFEHMAVGISVGRIAYEYIPEIKFLFVVAALMHAVGDGIMAGLLQDGTFERGLPVAMVMLIAGYLVLRFMGGM